jgi:hypothetical protein
MKAKLADVLGRERTLGPAPWFLLSGPVVKRGPDGEVLAEHADAFWIRDDHHFQELIFMEPARLSFEAPEGKQEVGAFGWLAARDGALYGDGRLLARLTPASDRWLLSAPAAIARDLVIEPAHA